MVHLAWEFIILHSRMIHFHFYVLSLVVYYQTQLPIYFRKKLEGITELVMITELDEKDSSFLIEML